MLKKLLAILLIFSLAFVVAGCDSRDADPPAESWLTVEERVYGLSLIWRYVADMSPFFYIQEYDFDWNGIFLEHIPKVINAQNMIEYYEVLSRFVALLGDGKSQVVPPRDFAIYAFPLQVRYIDGRYVVFAAHSDFTDMPVGSAIVSVNGVPTGEWLEANFGDTMGNHTPTVRETRLGLNITQANSEREMTLEVKTPDGESITESISLVALSDELMRAFGQMETLSVPPSARPTPLGWGATAFALDNDIHHITISTFTIAAMPEVVRDYIGRVAHSARAFILDIRGNGGGTSDFLILSQFADLREVGTSGAAYRQVRDAGAMMLAAHLTTSEILGVQLPDELWGMTVHGYTIEHGLNMLNSKHLERLYDFGQSDFWDVDLLYERSLRLFDIPVVILADYLSGSASESFVLTAQGAGNFTIMGTNTAGVAGDISMFALPGGGFLSLNVVKSLAPDGTTINNHGIAPDIWVSQNLDDLLEGTDTQLNAAVEYLLHRIN